MAFEFRDEWFHQYMTDGYVVFRNMIPPALLRDLRREADKARALAHEKNGRQAQRIQPIDRYADVIEQRPFQDYCELPVLRDAVTRLLGPDYTHGHRHIMGLLVEPVDRPWSIGWHRDGVVEVPIGAYDETCRSILAEARFDLRHFNQVNCPLYAESCTWFVPGSHLRERDLPGERQFTGDAAWAAEIAAMTPEEAELALLENCRSFPGAVQMHLEAGDYLLYRNIAWHNGNYVTYHPRATIHDTCAYHGEHNDWGKRWHAAKAAAVERHRAAAASEAVAAA